MWKLLSKKYFEIAVKCGLTGEVYPDKLIIKFIGINLFV